MITLCRVNVEKVIFWVAAQVKRANIVDDSGKTWSVKIQKSQRLNVFANSIKCTCCPREGAYFLLEQHVPTDNPHLNLYSHDGTLMTKDHIVPKAKGGRDIMKNYQTMCHECNHTKADNV